MGIKDLLPSLKSITKPKNIRAFAGQTVAIDGYCWLHQGAYTCAMDLAYGRGTAKLIQFCQKKLQMMIAFNVTPILIFDGARLMMKSNTEEERQKNRDEHRSKAEEYMKQGNSVMAHKMFSIAVDITPEMAYLLVQAAQHMQVQYIVAPYEADAQLAFMYLSGRVTAVITEDSDLLAFGVKRCFYKMDNNGDGQEVDLDNLASAVELNFRTFTLEMLLITCILSGCDYLESIKGIGFKKAHKLVYENGTDVQAILKKIRREGKQVVPQDYEANFEKALLTFKFQRVYCPVKKALVHLHDPDTHILGPQLREISKTDAGLEFLGKMISDETAQKIAQCEVDPNTHESYAATIQKRRELAQQQTKIVYKKNTQTKKGIVAPSPLTKFFGFQKPKVPQQTEVFELGDHDVVGDTKPAAKGFAFVKKAMSQPLLQESTEVKMLITSQPQVEPQCESKVSAYFKLQEDDEWTVKREKQVLEELPEQFEPVKQQGTPMERLMSQAHSLTRRAVGLQSTIQCVKDASKQIRPFNVSDLDQFKMGPSKAPQMTL